MKKKIKLKTLFADPKKFFQGLKGRSVRQSFLFFAGLTIVVMLLQNLYNFQTNMESIDRSIGIKMLAIAAIFLSYVILISLSSFVLYGIFHWILKIFKANIPFSDTYKLIYSSVPQMMVLGLPIMLFDPIIIKVLLSLALLYNLYLEFVGVCTLTKLRKPSAILAVLIHTVLLAGITLYLNTVQFI